MIWKKIDRTLWAREEAFVHFSSDLPCTYSLTAKLDITPLRQAGLRLYPAMLHALSTVVNRHEEFRTALDSDGNPGVFQELWPSYTIFHPDSETFSNLWTRYEPEYAAFLAGFERDLAQYGEEKGLLGKPNPPANTFPVSMLPWIGFEGFNLNLQKGYDYLLPIFTMGKFDERNGKTLLPLAVQVHHAVCDGFHLSRFLEELQALLFQQGQEKEL